MKKKFNKRKEKKVKREKNKIGNILKGKKLKEKKLVVGVLDVALLCIVHGATIKNNLFEDGDGKNTLCVFNPTHNFFKIIFETQKETCFNKEIQLNLK
jgi:hypothetical protein